MRAAGEQGAPAPRLRWLFVAAILTGSFLLFLVQPMVARMALPRLGGAPAVWNSAMLVYQALLLAGYGYAHALGRAPVRMQAAIHGAVLLAAALWLPIGLIATELPADAEPALWVPWLLGASIGPLFLAIAAQAPMLQRWYSAASGGHDPYALYAASNIGSFGGLLAYPLLVEPLLPLRAQSLLWSGGYALVLLLVAACATRLPRGGGNAPVRHDSAAPGWRRVLHWVALAFVPSGLMLATTTFLTTDIVAGPMLWVMPLGLYLLSFSVAFRGGGLLPDLLARFAPVTLLLFGATLMSGHQEFVYLNAAIGLALLFLVSVALHSCLYQRRPAPDRLTGFYLAMAVGGALGGVFAGLVAPVVFDWTYEYPLLILAAGMLVPRRHLLPVIARFWSGPPAVRRRRAVLLCGLVAALVILGITNPHGALGLMGEQVAFVLVALAGLLAVGTRIPFLVALAGGLFLFGGYRAVDMSLADARTRSYFGVYSVSERAGERRLAHGTTLHGVQLGGARARLPTTYYVANSGVGQAMRLAPMLFGESAHIGVVGLGTGTLACYARPGQHWTFYEIDPAVVGIARDSGTFTFLRQCLPDARIVLGDARLRLGQEPDASLDLLALDAFSSDAVPMHLMTEEAFAVYGRVLSRRGLLLVHVSNRFLDLRPVVAAAAARGGWHAAHFLHNPTPAEMADEAAHSDWIALSRDRDVLDALTRGAPGWTPLEPRPGFRGWTDDFASVVPLLTLFGGASAE